MLNEVYYKVLICKFKWHTIILSLFDESILWQMMKAYYVISNLVVCDKYISGNNIKWSV